MFKDRKSSLPSSSHVIQLPYDVNKSCDLKVRPRHYLPHPFVLLNTLIAQTIKKISINSESACTLYPWIKKSSSLAIGKIPGTRYAREVTKWGTTQQFCT